MLNLDDISQEVLIARGKYSTVKGEHEEAKRKLHGLCSRLQIAMTVTLKRSTSNPPEDVSDEILQMRQLLDEIDRVTVRIESLSAQRKALKEAAWPI